MLPQFRLSVNGPVVLKVRGGGRQGSSRSVLLSQALFLAGRLALQRAGLLRSRHMSPRPWGGGEVKGRVSDGDELALDLTPAPRHPGTSFRFLSSELQAPFTEGRT
jgi:hypothetical protein